ncbi:MAG: type II toxin-antitoxin system VapC family toxin [Gemmatimonadota bacterium]|nr:type II toxin-antitoxin system VapC family toxin [Gemmatimonadota bacterium]
MILLDTSVLIDAFGSDGPTRNALRAAIDAGHRILLPTLVLYEWWRGPRTSAVPFGPAEARVAAGLYGAVARPRGRELDLAIAACAISWNAALWSLNRRDFEDVRGLELWPDEPPT